MKPGIYKIEIEQGTDLTIPFTIAGYDLTGWTAKLQARTQYGAPTAFVTLTTEDGDISLGNGTFSITFSHEKTLNFPLGEWVYDMDITSPDNVILRPIKGKFVVNQEVTK